MKLQAAIILSFVAFAFGAGPCDPADGGGEPDQGSGCYARCTPEEATNEWGDLNGDCSCTDKAYRNCIPPEARNEVHTNSRDECIDQCILFNSFGDCEYIMYYGESGPDENCKMIAGTESMEEYLLTCNQIAQPTRRANGQCLSENDILCGLDQCTVTGAPAGCETCVQTPPDPCLGYQTTECSITAELVSTIKSSPNFEACASQCTIGSVSEPNTYFNYDRETQECSCYFKGNRRCNVEVIAAGFLTADINKCKNSGPGPTPTTTPPPGCSSDADCSAPLLCDGASSTCVDGCRDHNDCDSDEYCTCNDLDLTPCPDPMTPGTCQTGCRDQGDSCDGGSGSCNNHVCSTDGDPQIASIEVTTTSCVGCGSDDGAVLSITTSIGVTCRTLELSADYTDSNPDGFSGPILGGCNKWASGDAATVGIEWPHAGTWVPDQVKIVWNTEFVGPFCCTGTTSTLNCGSC